MQHAIWRTVPQRAVLALALVVALAGCAPQAATSDPSSPTATNASVASPSPAVSPTATFVVIEGTPGAYGPACHASQLTLKISINFSSADQMGTLTNHSATACSLFGFPGPQLLDVQHQSMTTHVYQSTSSDVWSGVFPEQHVQLAPGASAYFASKWSKASGGADTNCPASSYLSVSVPDDSGAIVAADPIHACNGDLTVSPFQNAPFMAS